MAGEAPIAIGPGTVIAGSYEVTELIGRGGMGAVWAARHLRLPGKRVAIKVLLGTGVGEQALARFRREAEITSRIGHPNIVEVLDFNTLGDGTPYQVLEFLDGESLGQRLRRGTIPLDQTLEMVLQIGSALRAAHRAGVVHRDLKPDNIFLSPSDAGGVIHDRAKVLDFGISKIRGSQTLQTQESILIGTPQYMSPEQASGKNQEIDPRTDVFALGAIVYEMLAGRPAFSGDSLVAVILDVVQGTPTPLARLLPALPIEVDRAVMRALAKRPDDRFAEIGDFVTALTGRTLQTLGSDARRTAPVAGTPASAPSGARPLSAEEMMGETMAPPPTGSAGSGGTAVMPPVATPSLPTAIAPAPGATSGAASASEVTPAGSAKSMGSPTAKSSASLWAGLGAVALLAIAAGVWLPRMQRVESRVGAGAGPATVAPVVVSPSPTTPAPIVVAERPVEAPPPEPKVEVNPAPKIDAQGEAKKESKKDGARAGHVVAESISPQVAAQLDEAERILAAGDAGEAIRKTRQSFFTQKTDRGWALLARAFCAKGDLENARASIRNLRPASPARAAAVRACKARGIDLR